MYMLSLYQEDGAEGQFISNDLSKLKENLKIFAEHCEEDGDTWSCKVKKLECKGEVVSLYDCEEILKCDCNNYQKII